MIINYNYLVIIRERRSIMRSLFLMLIIVKVSACYPHYDFTQIIPSVISSIQRYLFSNCVIILDVQVNAGNLLWEWSISVRVCANTCCTHYPVIYFLLPGVSARILINKMLLFFTNYWVVHVRKKSVILLQEAISFLKMKRFIYGRWECLTYN